MLFAAVFGTVLSTALSFAVLFANANMAAPGAKFRGGWLIGLPWFVTGVVWIQVFLS